MMNTTVWPANIKHFQEGVYVCCLASWGPFLEAFAYIFLVFDVYKNVWRLRPGVKNYKRMRRDAGNSMRLF